MVFIIGKLLSHTILYTTHAHIMSSYTQENRLRKANK